MSKEISNKTICFDYTHNNVLTIESPSYSDFTQFLFGSSFRLGKIQAGFTTLDKLKKYKMVVIGAPRQSYIEIEEIDVLVEFVKNGGSLLVIHDEGGDYQAETNLSELTEHFGFTYNTDIIFDSMNYINQQNRVIVKDFEPHPVTRNIQAIVQSSACSISINELIEADEEIKIIPLARTGLNSYRNRWDGSEWIEDEDAPRSIMAVAVNYYKGKVIGLTTVSMFSSLSSTYGFFAQNNQDFIANIFNWLLTPSTVAEDEVLINVNINYNLFSWMEQKVNANEWNSIEDIINFSVKYLKDNYKGIMKDLEERKRRLKEERKKQLEELKEIKDKGLRCRKEAQIKAEMEILERAGEGLDTGKALQEIMATLYEITGGEVGGEFDPRLFEEEEGTRDLHVIKEERSEEEQEKEEKEGISKKEEEIKDEETEQIGEEKDKKEREEQDSKREEVEEEKGEEQIDTKVLESYNETEEEPKKVKEEHIEREKEEIFEEEKKDIPAEEEKLTSVDDLAESIKKELEKKIKSRLSEVSPSVKEGENKEESTESVLNVLGDLDVLNKKIEEFKSMTDEDEPVAITKETINKFKSEIIEDDDVFES